MTQIIINDIVVDVIRKKIKTLRLVVSPPEGRVKIAVPLRSDEATLRLFILSKLSWIRKHQARFMQQVLEAPREYLSGEGLYYQGERYQLNLIPHEGRTKIKINSAFTLDFYIHPDSDIASRERAIITWYRRQLTQEMLPLLDKWQTIIGVRAADCRIKQMKTKWGSCNTRTHRIWLSLELIKKSRQCLEYVIVHELVHLLEPSHNHRFKAFMDKFMPEWRVYKRELNNR